MTHRLREIEPHEIEEALKSPPNFGYGGDNDEMFETWSLGPVIRHRDSDILQQSNAAVMERELERLAEAGEISADDYEIVSCNHWAVGWVDHLSFRAVDSDGEATKVFSHIMEMMDSLSDYPVLDDSDYSERKYDAQHESIEYNACDLRDDLPEDWVNQIWSWLWENNQEALDGEDRGYVSEEDIRAACEALDFLEPDEDL